MIEDYRLEAAQVPQGRCLEQKSMATEPCGQPGHGGSGTAEGACDLAMGAAGDEAGGDGGEQLGALEVVGRREALARKTSAAGRTAKPRDAAVGIASAAVGAIVRAAIASPEGVIGAFFPGTVRRAKSGRAFVLYGCTGSQHGPATFRKVDAVINFPEFTDRRRIRDRIRTASDRRVRMRAGG